MAGGERFELPTLWFEARYSNPTELTAGKNGWKAQNSSYFLKRVLLFPPGGAGAAAQ